MEAKIAERAAADEQVKLLESVPGLGHYSAVAIASRIGDINRFKRPDSLANFFGLTPGCRNSGEATQRLGSITKRGSKMVRYLLNQAVIKVLRFDGTMRTWFKRIKKRRGSKIAPRGGDAPPGDDPLAHAQEEAEVPLRFAHQEAPGIRGL